MNSVLLKYAVISIHWCGEEEGKNQSRKNEFRVFYNLALRVEDCDFIENELSLVPIDKDHRKANSVKILWFLFCISILSISHLKIYQQVNEKNYCYEVVCTTS